MWNWCAVVKRFKSQCQGRWIFLIRVFLKYNVKRHWIEFWFFFLYKYQYHPAPIRLHRYTIKTWTIYNQKFMKRTNKTRCLSFPINRTLFQYFGYIARDLTSVDDDRRSLSFSLSLSLYLYVSFFFVTLQWLIARATPIEQRTQFE